MAHEQVPDDGAEAFGVGRDPLAGDRGNDDADVGDLFRVAAVAPDHTEDLRFHFAGQLEGSDQVKRHIFRLATSSYGEDQHAVALSQTRTLEPLRETCVP